MIAKFAKKTECLSLRHSRRRVSNRFVDLRYPFILILVSTIFIFSQNAFSQARVDLEDLNVKGELLNDNRMRMSSRESTRVQDRVKYRKNFRPEIIDGIDLRLPAAETLEEVDAK